LKKLARELVARMPQLTALRYAEVALANTRLNQPYLDRTISDLAVRAGDSRGNTAVVVGAGPSLHRQNPAEQLLRFRYNGEVVCADGALPYCLRNGLVPDYVVTLDPHPTRIVRWFGDPDLSKNTIARDDYFRHQDLDPVMNSDEIDKNRQVIALVDEYGPKMKVIIATCASQRVTRRCLQAGLELYWWNPLYDDFTDPNSLTRQVYRLNKAPCMGTGGNTGSAAWVFANVVLRKKRIALVGMDLGYAPGTPLTKTQYYTELAELFGDDISEAYVEVFNPYTNETWITDPTYYWYRETLLQMVRDADCVTYNCTEGGIVFGEGVEFLPLKEFLGNWAERKDCG
jgi:hypothetical protein